MIHRVSKLICSKFQSTSQNTQDQLGTVCLNEYFHSQIGEKVNNTALMLMGVLDPGSAHARPSDRPPINMREKFSATCLLGD